MGGGKRAAGGRASRTAKAAGKKSRVKKAAAGRKKTPAASSGRQPAAPLPYRFLEHTADIMIEADGNSYLDALQNIARGMFSVLGQSRPKAYLEIDEMAGNREELVVYVLSRILAECDARRLVPCRTDVLLYDESAPRLRVKVWGEVKNARDSIKAVTFHELLVKRDEKTQKWKIRVLFDV